MKILIIHNRYLYAGGEEEVLRSELEMLQKHGHQVRVYERSNKEASSLNVWGKLNFVCRDLLYSLKTYKDITAIVDEFQPDIAHIHNLFYMMSPSVLVALAKRNIPVVQTLHNYRYLCAAGTFFREGKVCESCLTQSRFQAIKHRCFKGSFVYSLMLTRLIDRYWSGEYLKRHIKTFIALSQFSRQKFVNNGFDEKQVVVKPNFLNYDPGLKTSQGSHALYVGTMQSYKGVKTLLRAWQLLPNEYQLKLAGDGPLLEDLKKFNTHPGVTFLGRCSQERVVALIKDSRCVILPSECYENFPRVIVEAYACGVGVIASRLGAIAELVEVGKTGLLFNSGNHDELASCVQRIWQDDDLAVQLGLQARKIFLERYTEKVNLQQLMMVYKQALEGIGK